MNQISIKKILSLLLCALLSSGIFSKVFAESYNTSNGTSTIQVETTGDANVHIQSNSKTNSTNSVQDNSNKSIHVESNNNDTKSQVIINGKKVYEGNSGRVEVQSNTSTTSKNGNTSINSESKTTVTTQDGKTTVIVEKNGDTSTIKNNDISATTDLNVAVDKTNNKLKITIGDKIEEIDLLPDQAVKVVVDDKILDTIKNSNGISITTRDGEVIYKIVGTKKTKLFGLVPVQYSKTAEVNAKNGKVTSLEAPFYAKLLDLFSR